MSGSLRYLPSAARTALHDHIDVHFDGRRRAALQRSAPLRQLHADDDAELAPAAQGSRPRAARRRVRRRLPLAHEPQPARRDQAALDERPRRRRRRQHLRERGAVPRGHPPAASRRPNRARALRAARDFGARRAARRHRGRRHDAAQFRRRRRQAGLLPRLAARLRARRRAVRAVAARAIERRVLGPARDVLLSALPSASSRASRRARRPRGAGRRRRTARASRRVYSIAIACRPLFMSFSATLWPKRLERSARAPRRRCLPRARWALPRPGSAARRRLAARRAASRRRRRCSARRSR